MVELVNIGKTNYDVGGDLVNSFMNSEVLQYGFLNQWYVWLLFFMLAIVFGWFLSKSQQYSVFKR